MQRRELLKYLTGMPLGAAALNVDGIQHPSVEGVAFPPQTQSRNPCQLLYLHPGELTFLLGRPSNGKTLLALSIALDFVDAGAGPVWFFSLGRRSQETAALLGLELQRLPNAGHSSDSLFEDRQYRGVRNGRELPVIFFDSYFATSRPLPEMAGEVPALAEQQPRLVIYDADTLDCTTLTNDEEHCMAFDLAARRRECAELYAAPLVGTLAIPSGTSIAGDDKRPRMEELKPRRDQTTRRALVNEVYFVHRPVLYQQGLAMDQLDLIELTRGNRVRPESRTRLLVQDATTRRLRTLNHAEVQLLIEHS